MPRAKKIIKEIQSDEVVAQSVIKKSRKPSKPRKPRVQIVPMAPAESPKLVQKTSVIAKYRSLILLNGIFLMIVLFVFWKLSSSQKPDVLLPIPPIVEALTTTASSTPAELIIPSIGLSSHVQLVGKTVKGNMAVPNNFTDVGWYRLGFYPGSFGNSVIAGHLDNGKGTPAVFAHLRDLKIGDQVQVLNKGGDILTFSVTGTALYDYTNAPLSMIFGTSSKAHLNLITCDGVWDSAKKIYDKRLIVYTELQSIVLKNLPPVNATTTQTNAAKKAIKNTKVIQRN